MHILSGKSKCIDRSSSRERESLNFVISLTLRTRLRISKFLVYLCKKIVIDEMFLSVNGICTDGEQAKAFWFSEGGTKV